MPKVTKIITGSVVVLGLWLASTAYVSSNTKSYLNEYITKSNRMHNANGIQMHIENFEKGFFSSTAKIKIDFMEPNLKKLIAQTWKLPIEVDYRIENGPLFFKETLGLGLSRIHSDVNLSDYVVKKESFQNIVKDDVHLSSTMSIDFLKNASFNLISNNIVAKVKGDEIYLSPLNIEGTMNIETFKGQIKMFVNSIVAENKQEVIKAKNIVFEADSKKLYDNGFYLGDFVISLDSLEVKDELLPFELKGAKIALNMNIDENKDKTINMKFKLKADAGDSTLPMAYASLSKVELSYALKGTKLEGILAFQDFTKNLQAKQQDLVSRLQLPTGELDMEVFSELEKMQVKTAEEMFVRIAGLLQKDSTNFNAEIKMTDKKSKTSNLKMNIAYVGDEVLGTSAKEIEEKFRKDFLNLLDIHFDVELEKGYINNLPEQFQQELAGQLNMGTTFGIVQENNNSFSFVVNYKGKRLMVNGRDRSELLQMLELGLKGKGL